MIYEMLSGINPFKLKNKNKFEKLQMIMEEDIKMLPMFSQDATDLLTKLLMRNVSVAGRVITDFLAKTQIRFWPNRCAGH